MSGILRAHEGRIEMLNAIFGGGEGGKAKDGRPTSPATPDALKGALRFFGRKKAA